MILQQSGFRKRLTYTVQFDTPQMHALFADPAKMVTEHLQAMYKNKPGDTSTVARIDYAGKDLVVKRYNLKGLGHQIKRAILPTKASVSWENALLLQSLGIPSIRPVALIEERYGWIKRVSYLITEYQEGVLGNDYFSSGAYDVAQLQKTIHSVVSLLKSMKKHHLVHDDFQFHNMLIVDGAAVLLDLDHMRQYSGSSKAFEKAHQKDIDHFARFLLHTPVIHRMFTDAVAGL